MTTLNDAILALIDRERAAERERCAKVAAGWKASVSTGFYREDELNLILETIGPSIAIAIRALAPAPAAPVVEERAAAEGGSSDE